MTYKKPRIELVRPCAALIEGQPTILNVIFKHGGCPDTHPQLLGFFFVATPSAYEADE